MEVYCSTMCGKPPLSRPHFIKIFRTSTMIDRSVALVVVVPDVNLQCTGSIVVALRTSSLSMNSERALKQGKLLVSAGIDGNTKDRTTQ